MPAGSPAAEAAAMRIAQQLLTPQPPKGRRARADLAPPGEPTSPRRGGGASSQPHSPRRSKSLGLSPRGSKGVKASSPPGRQSRQHSSPVRPQYGGGSTPSAGGFGFMSIPETPPLHPSPIAGRRLGAAPFDTDSWSMSPKSLDGMDTQAPPSLGASRFVRRGSGIKRGPWGGGSKPHSARAAQDPSTPPSLPHSTVTSATAAASGGGSGARRTRRSKLSLAASQASMVARLAGPKKQPAQALDAAPAAGGGFATTLRGSGPVRPRTRRQRPKHFQ